jgi:hypothetical protein
MKGQLQLGGGQASAVFEPDPKFEPIVLTEPAVFYPDNLPDKKISGIVRISRDPSKPSVFVPTVGNELKLLPNVSTVGTVVPSSSGKPIRGNINTKTGAAPTFTPDTSILSGGTVSGENWIS